MKIYTKTGDKGETGLLDGSRVAKNDLRVAAYGDVDELNSVLGIVRASTKNKKIRGLLLEIQKDLFSIGAQLAHPELDEKKFKKAKFPDSKVMGLEKIIDDHEEKLPELKGFIVSGGALSASFLHLARTVCRRAERTLISLHQAERVPDTILKYMNRLSDLLFVLARAENQDAGEETIPW